MDAKQHAAVWRKTGDDLAMLARNKNTPPEHKARLETLGLFATIVGVNYVLESRKEPVAAGKVTGEAGG